MYDDPTDYGYGTCDNDGCDANLAPHCTGGGCQAIVCPVCDD
ncbi:hypothetical protein [Streptomyces javensis]|nr:hypothetical protein [Streptomyces javensis]